MSQLPQIVRERLRASAPPGAHPDADVLTAFSEHSLPANERAVVTEHLARCGDCREILALALPTSESAQADEVHAVRPSKTWLSWPVMRWGFAVAGIAIVAGVGVVQYQRHTRPTQMAYFKKAASAEAVQPPPAASAPAEVKLLPPPSPGDANPEPSHKTLPLTTSPALRDQARSSPQIPERSQPTGAAEDPGITTRSGGRLSTKELGANVTMKAAPNESAAASPAPAAYPAAAVPQQTPSNNLSDQAPAQQLAETVEVQSQATTVTTQDQDQGRDSTQKQLDLPRAQQQRASSDPIYFHAEGDKEMSRAKAPVPQAPENATSAYANGGPIPVGIAGRSSLPLAAPTWNISSTGSLQRSLDGGKAWEDVDVSNVRLITSEGGLASGVLAKDSRAPEARKENKKEKTDDGARKTPASSAQTFRAVSANAFDVWAGGSGGALYHSVDGGNQWTRVFPTVNSVVLTGDIVSILFSDSEHGTLTTSVAETWTTTDAGHSWQRH